MDLRELRADRLPGLADPLILRGEPGVNLVLGPNGSGKSSLCRAALGLLWSDPRGRGVVAATWEHDGVRWHARREGGDRVHWQRDGNPADPPPVPPGRLAGAFRLGLLDLLKPAADATDTELARAVRSQLAGGYDLAGLLAQETVSGREGRKERDAWQQADREVRELEATRRELREQEGRLRRLRERLAAAEQAARRAESLAAAEVVQQARVREADAREHLHAHHAAHMDRLQPDTHERLDTLRSRQRRAAADQETARQELAAADTDLAAADLPDGGPPDQQLARARQHLDRARALAAERDRAIAEEAGRAAAVQAATQQLAPWGPPEAGHPVDAATLRAEAGAVSQHLTQRATGAALDRLLAHPELAGAAADTEAEPGPDGPPAAPPAAPDPDRHARARAALAAWLAAAGERPPLAVWLLAAAALAGAGAWLAPWRDDPRGWFLLAAGALLATAALIRRLHRPATARARAAHAASGVTAPGRWRGPAVAAALDATLADEADARDRRRRAALREVLAAERSSLAMGAPDADAGHRDPATPDADAGDQGAADPGAADPAVKLDAAERLHRNAAYHQAVQEHAAATARREQLDDELDAALAAARQPLAPWLPADLATGRDPDPLAAALEDLAARAARHREATRRAADARRRLEDAQQVQAEARAEAEDLLARLGLGPEDDAVVLAMARRLDRWRDDTAAVARAQTERELAENALARLPQDQRATAEAALSDAPAALAAALQAARTEAAGAEELQKEVVAIETRLDAAGHDAALDRAHAAREAAAASLAAVRTEVGDTALRRLLLEHLRAEHRRAAEPAVLQRARDLLRRVTAGVWDLHLADQDTETFRATDNRTGRGHALSELSDGTRAQLLLAARLAFLQEAERGLPLPLFLDESLTASDARRFAAVVAAVVDLVRREGRQVFYLTCDPADVDAWQHLLREAGLPPAPVTELAAATREATAAPRTRLRPQLPPLPAPPGPDTDPVTYATALQVPPVDPHAPAAAAHLFHLLRDDLPTLHALLRRGVARLGQIAPLQDVLAHDGVLGPADAAGILARGRALDAFLAAFATGRGRPLPAGAIARESGIASSKLGEVDDLAHRLAGDATALLAALEQGAVARFQRDKREELSDWLQREGYLDPRPPRDLDGVRQDVTRAVRADLAQGRLSLPELAQLLPAWWTAAGGDAGPQSGEGPQIGEGSRGGDGPRSGEGAGGKPGGGGQSGGGESGGGGEDSGGREGDSGEVDHGGEESGGEQAGRGDQRPPA